MATNLNERKEYSYGAELMEVGKEAEDLFYSRMKLMGKKIVDVREKEEYQKKKIDFLIGNRSLDIKNDRHFGETGNLLLEWEYLFLETRVIHRCWGHPDCKNHAEFFVFLKQTGNGNSEFWIYKTEQYLNGFWEALDEQDVQIKLVNSDKKKSTICFVFPERYCQPFQIFEGDRNKS